MPTAKQNRPTLKGDQNTRAPVSQSTIEDPLYVAVSPTSLDDVAWAAVGREYEYGQRGYTYVKPDELELMEGLQFQPRDKHFGVYFDFDKNAERIRQGQHVLMRVNRKARQERLDRESDRMQNLRPKKSDRSEQAALTEADATTLDKELT